MLLNLLFLVQGGFLIAATAVKVGLWQAVQMYFIVGMLRYLVMTRSMIEDTVADATKAFRENWHKHPSVPMPTRRQKQVALMLYVVSAWWAV